MKVLRDVVLVLVADELAVRLLQALGRPLYSVSVHKGLVNQVEHLSTTFGGGHPVGRQRIGAFHHGRIFRAAFRTAIVDLLTQDLHGDYYRLGSYEEDGEINLVLSHGTPVSITPIGVGNREKIRSLREVTYAVLRYSPAEGLLRIDGSSVDRGGKGIRTQVIPRS